MFKKKASASEDVTLQVVVPNNAKPGDQLKVKVPGGGDAIITIPPESIPSTRITVKVNSSTAPVYMIGCIYELNVFCSCNITRLRLDRKKDLHATTQNRR